MSLDTCSQIITSALTHECVYEQNLRVGNLINNLRLIHLLSRAAAAAELFQSHRRSQSSLILHAEDDGKGNDEEEHQEEEDGGVVSVNPRVPLAAPSFPSQSGEELHLFIKSECESSCSPSERVPDTESCHREPITAQIYNTCINRCEVFKHEEEEKIITNQSTNQI